MYANPSSSPLANPALATRAALPLAVPMARRVSGIELTTAHAEPAPRWFAVGRSGHSRPAERGFSIWFQLRGRTRLSAREGEFDLGPGEWLALERDSAPDLLASAHGATLGLVLPGDVGGRGRAELLPGRGRMTARDLRIALRLWRNAERLSTLVARDPMHAQRALQSLLAHFIGQQRSMDAAIARCPGRSVRRKRQVFGRMQRARLFLEGHRHRVVRLTELAELTSFSSWYLSKTFHCIYDESPQAASVRLRLERACELLAQSDCAIGEVGAACGFDNSCSFARAFRARFRVTATAYRESARAVRHVRA
ncbi:MAG: helix-turn-helix transcriptional regulator [Xanthomonadaceae bacterium]|nr:helix-turn-helix transcriptional regulator [Xanthomonadaceae bacterium]